MREVTEDDFRKDEFKGAKPEDYEFDGTGELVRKDRFATAMRDIANTIGFLGRSWRPNSAALAVEALHHFYVCVKDIKHTPAQTDPVKQLEQVFERMEDASAELQRLGFQGAL